eukprot:3161829-Amphidinium_carterae.1
MDDQPHAEGDMAAGTIHRRVGAVMTTGKLLQGLGCHQDLHRDLTGCACQLVASSLSLHHCQRPLPQT